MGSSGTQPHDWREWRRMRALDLARQGWKQRDIAVALDASKGAVSRWLAAARRGGPEALRSHPAPGAVPKITPEQVRLIPDFLWHGAEAYGFRGEVWTCERVAGVLLEEFGVSYSVSQVSRLLKRLGWTPQVPLTRAIQRDEAVIQRWRVETWPALKKKARRERRGLVFLDEWGFYLLPGVVKTVTRHKVGPRNPDMKFGRGMGHVYTRGESLSRCLPGSMPHASPHPRAPAPGPLEAPPRWPGWPLHRPSPRTRP